MTEKKNFRKAVSLLRLVGFVHEKPLPKAFYCCLIGWYMSEGHIMNA